MVNKISVITPMYNAELYIRECIQSVIEQTYRNWEILVIDDGSTDRSLEICREFSLTDNRIKLYHQENGGVSRARNFGLDIAKGEYIFFLDSDDAIHPLLLEEMMGQAQDQRADMVFCDLARIDTSEMENVIKTASVKEDRPSWQIAEGIEAEEWFHVRYAKILAGVWGLIRRDCIGTLKFDEDLVNGEDTLFKYRLFCKQFRTAYSPAKWYYYRIHPESVSHSVETIQHDRNFYSCMTIRDNEYKRGHYEFALERESMLTFQIRERYNAFKKLRDKNNCKRLKKIAVVERSNPLFQSLKFSIRFMFICCFFCYPMYVPLNKMVKKLWEWKERPENEEK